MQLTVWFTFVICSSKATADDESRRILQMGGGGGGGGGVVRFKGFANLETYSNQLALLQWVNNLPFEKKPIFWKVGLTND